MIDARESYVNVLAHRLAWHCLLIFPSNHSVYIVCHEASSPSENGAEFRRSSVDPRYCSLLFNVTTVVSGLLASSLCITLALGLDRGAGSGSPQERVFVPLVLREPGEMGLQPRHVAVPQPAPAAELFVNDDCRVVVAT